MVLQFFHLPLQQRLRLPLTVKSAQRAFIVVFLRGQLGAALPTASYARFQRCTSAPIRPSLHLVLCGPVRFQSSDLVFQCFLLSLAFRGLFLTLCLASPGILFELSSQTTTVHFFRSFDAAFHTFSSVRALAPQRSRHLTEPFISSIGLLRPGIIARLLFSFFCTNMVTPRFNPEPSWSTNGK